MASPLSAAGASPEPSPSSPLSPLLRLPPHTRQRIYRYLGLESWDGRPDTFYLYAGHLKRGHSPCISRHPPPDPKSYHGLLLSCRAIHAETTGLLYSSNHFVLYYCKPPEHPGYPISSRPLRTLHPTSFRPLHTLHALTESSLHSLSNLKIVLNEAAGHQLPLSLYSEGSCCADGRGNPEPNYLLNPDFFLASEPRHKGLHRLPLLSSASMEDHSDKWAATNSILGEWNVAATRLLSHIAPGRLSLSVVCDIDPKHPQALDIAKSVVAPIRLLPPSNLKECRVRLTKTPDGRLRQLAEDTVSYACGIPTMSREPPSNMAATLTTLPRELRIKILEYTDLVTPRRQVIWTRQQRAYTVLTPACGPGRPPDDLHSFQFFECWRDSSKSGASLNGCFCRRRHAAFSLECKCWCPPGPALFLLSRALYQDAQFVFFSSNRFIIHDYKITPAWVVPVLELYPLRNPHMPIPGCPYPYPNERFAASEFLREVVPEASLAHLRFLEFVFPRYLPASWPETQHPAMQDWWETIHWLQDKINITRMTGNLTVIKPGNAPFSYLRPITTEEGGTLMTAFTNLMTPFKRLADNGLARFYAHLPYPWRGTEESIIRHLSDSSWLNKETIALKERSERYVMGSRYDLCKPQQSTEDSDWM